MKTNKRKKGIYERFFKRFFDIILSLLALVVLSPFLLIIMIILKITLKKEIFLHQYRPGRDGKIFKLHKFRSMTNEVDEKGVLLEDSKRVTKFGKFMRRTGIDELPQLINILKGDMSVIGPRPQLVRDMVFMSDEQRMRHTARPGLSGLAQVKGRNAIAWEDKLDWDLKYIQNITFLNDVKIVLMTVKNVFGHNESEDELDVTLDYGDALLKDGKVSKDTYDMLQEKAIAILSERNS